MKLSDLKEEYKKDVVIDITSLESEAVRIPTVHAKWLNYRAQAKSLMIVAERNLHSVRRDRFMFYTGRHNEEVCDFVLDKQQDLKYIMAGDEQILQSETRYEHCKATLSYVDEALKGISSMGFTIKNVVDLRKLQSGIV